LSFFAKANKKLKGVVKLDTLFFISSNVVKFYNKRRTAEQWIKEGKYALNWTGCSKHKSEYRNPKQIQNTNYRNSKPLSDAVRIVLNIKILNLEFVSDFGFRASDLETPHLCLI
jgi:hypothetical protein